MNPGDNEEVGMAVTIRIPTVLRRLTDGQDELQVSGGTVAEVLVCLRTGHAPLVERITEAGAIRPYLNVFVNGEDIRFADGLNTPVRAGDEISIVPSIAGGR
jgi:sulfur-carrier protein